MHNSILEPHVVELALHEIVNAGNGLPIPCSHNTFSTPNLVFYRRYLLYTQQLVRRTSPKSSAPAKVRLIYLFAHMMTKYSEVEYVK